MTNPVSQSKATGSLPTRKPDLEIRVAPASRAQVACEGIAGRSSNPGALLPGFELEGEGMS